MTVLLLVLPAWLPMSLSKAGNSEMTRSCCIMSGLRNSRLQINQIRSSVPTAAVLFQLLDSSILCGRAGGRADGEYVLSHDGNILATVKRKRDGGSLILEQYLALWSLSRPPPWRFDNKLFSLLLAHITRNAPPPS